MQAGSESNSNATKVHRISRAKCTFTCSECRVENIACGKQPKEIRENKFDQRKWWRTVAAKGGNFFPTLGSEVPLLQGGEEGSFRSAHRKSHEGRGRKRTEWRRGKGFGRQKMTHHRGHFIGTVGHTCPSVPKISDTAPARSIGMQDSSKKRHLMPIGSHALFFSFPSSWVAHGQRNERPFLFPSIPLPFPF